MRRGLGSWLCLFPHTILRERPLMRYLNYRKYATNMTDLEPLSDYWDAHRIGESENVSADSPIGSPVSLRFRPGDKPDNRTRAFSDAMVLETFRPALTPSHPASSLPDFLDTFGPLIFPLYRAALLRKRILFMTEAPVHMPCKYGTTRSPST